MLIYVSELCPCFVLRDFRCQNVIIEENLLRTRLSTRYDFNWMFRIERPFFWYQDKGAGPLI